VKRSSLCQTAYLFFLVLGCAIARPLSQPSIATQPAVPDIWPKTYDDETYLFKFDSFWTQEKAIGSIKSLQDSMLENRADFPISELSADAFGMRARWSWMGNSSLAKSAGSIVPFDQVASILLEHHPTLLLDYKWA
jgi:hypothetical protein